MHRAPLILLYLNVLVIATCGLIYELLAGTLASYVLGDSVTQFSLVIGVYLSALGVGAWLSGFIQQNPARYFIEVELAVALVGGVSAPLLFMAFAWVQWFQLALFGLVAVIGILVGLELPLLMRILKDHLDFNELVSRVLTFDYIGALLASLLFPVLLVPHLGLVRTSLLFGLLNAAVGYWGTWLLRPLLRTGSLAGLRGRAILVAGLLIAGMIKADSLTSLAEENIFPHPIVHAETSPYQRIVLTQNRQGFQLYLNGHLQFNSVDEYRYHEALVHPAMSLSGRPARVLVLGGGDGLATRELLRYPGVESVTVVDIDPRMTSLGDRFQPLAELNQNAFDDPRVRVVNEDAFVWMQRTNEEFDAAVIDFPDPGTYSVGKLYSRRFFSQLRQRLVKSARIGVQCTSPLVAPQSYWCIVSTLESAGFSVRPYHAAVPSFGIWGFALASPGQQDATPPVIPEVVSGQLRFLTNSVARRMFDLPPDLQRVDADINRLNNQVLVRYYESEWGRWN